MNFTRTLGSMLLLAAFGSTAHAQMTREQVKAELADAIRTGDIFEGESGLKLNEINPGRYPARPLPAGKTRVQVKAELAEAIRTGDMLAGGESELKLNEIYPDRYPAKTVLAGKTREQVKVELAEAIRTGDLLANGESGQTLYEMVPERYAKARQAVYARTPSATTAAASAALAH
jgi:hypothetical protein